MTLSDSDLDLFAPAWVAAVELLSERTRWTPEEAAWALLLRAYDVQERTTP